MEPRPESRKLRPSRRSFLAGGCLDLCADLGLGLHRIRPLGQRRAARQHHPRRRRRWAGKRGQLAGYDPGGVFSNPFLDTLFG